MRQYPIGIQTFSEIRNNGYIYIDKTEYLWKLATQSKYFFLSRPRRFGKSLFISTLEAFFEGKRELFKGLAIDSKDYDWKSYPVLHLDLNTQDYTKDDNSLTSILDEHLQLWENKYEIEPHATDIALRFASIIREVSKKTGKQVVILIDEYDKPLLMNLFNQGRNRLFRNTLKSFYGALKSCDRYIRFAFLTGVTKFGKVSVFSDLNNLNDISLDSQFNGICGISESELISYFESDIPALAESNNISVERATELLKANYDGYHFTAPESEGIYNPFSLLCVFQKMTFGFYWFHTGTPTMLIELLNKTNTNLSQLSEAERSSLELMGIDPAFRDPIPVIFQSGYLTIRGYDNEWDRYRLGFPNEEVKRGFLEALLPYYADERLTRNDMNVFRMVDALRKGDLDLFMDIVKSLMAGIPYHNVSQDCESRFHDLMYIICNLMGLKVNSELRTSRGNIDMTVETDRYVYIFEFKVNRSPAEAIKQINEKGYADRYLADPREVVKVGVRFSTRTRNITRWITE